MFGRKVIVEFLTEKGQAINRLTQLDGIDVKFKIDMPMSAIQCDAEIKICNLKRSDISFLTTFSAVWRALQERRRIRIWAGYEDTEVNLIFDGDIIEALPTQPPDIWMECTARSMHYGTTQSWAFSVKEPISVQGAFNYASGIMGIQSEWRATSQKQIKKFCFNGNYQELMGKLNSLDDVIFFEEFGKLVAVDKKAPVRDNQIRLVSQETGMVGVPKIDYIGCEVKLLLDTKIKRGDTIQLVSQRVPAADGLYYVYNITHEGHLRGTDFYTTLKCRRLDAYGKELQLGAGNG